MSGKRISIRARRAVSGYLFILPFIIGFLCFMLLPLVDSFRIHRLVSFVSYGSYHEEPASPSIPFSTAFFAGIVTR